MNMFLSFALASYFTLPVIASAASCDSVPSLKGFATNTKAFMDADIVKFDRDCKPVNSTLFSENEIKSKAYIDIKDKKRSGFCHTTKDKTKTICLKDIAPGQNVDAGKAPIGSLDRAENLISGQELIDSLTELEKLGLKSFELENKPWSDWYWPIAVGQLSYRYADKEMSNAYYAAGLEESEIWPWMNEYHTNNPVELSTPSDVNKLSPSEKYDLLMGDSNYTLTKNQLSAGKSYYENYRKVEAWMGLCHGWAPASYMLPRPANSITVKAAISEQEITFKPSDLKALGTLLWATGQQQNKFVGGRCNKKNPAKDPLTGRILDLECFDNNPGSWHIAITTQLGLNKKPFVMDATYDYEVWNHPVVGYAIEYFNPNKLTNESDLSNAVVAIEEMENDKFSKYRSINAKYLVGITMKVEYAVETMPSTRDNDKAYYDATVFAHYRYDLELDESGKIIGGEWYTNKHPDFLWTPYDGSHARSILDQYLPAELSLDQITHPQITPYAPQVSSNGQPIGKVVEALFKESARSQQVKK